jgi:hypothetical protein
MHEQLNNFYQDCSKVLFNKKIRFKKINLLLSRQQYVEGEVSKVNIIKSVFYIFKKIVKGFKL